LTFSLTNQLWKIGIQVVFAGFSAEALAQRISAAKSKYLVTSDIGMRAKKQIPLKSIVDDALTKLDCEDLVKTVMVFERSYHEKSSQESPKPYVMKAGRDIHMNPLVQKQKPYCIPEWMDAEDELFILYTSGSTGMPKGGFLHKNQKAMSILD
jgi:acetyl-CoA synthetase